MTVRSFTLNVRDAYPGDNREDIETYLASAKTNADKQDLVDALEANPIGGASGWEELRELFDKMDRIINGDQEIGSNS